MLHMGGGFQGMVEGKRVREWITMIPEQRTFQLKQFSCRTVTVR